LLITDTTVRDNDYMGVVINNVAAWDCEDARGVDPGTTPGDRAQRDVLITDKAAGDGEHIGAMFTDTKSVYYQPPPPFCLTRLFFVSEGYMFVRRACFPLKLAPLNSLTS